MICPHYNKEGINFNRIYCWPYGTKICSDCGKQSKMQKKPILSCISACLALISFIPTVIFNNYYLLIPSIPLVLVLDYFMDRKYRTLIGENT